MNTFFDFEDQLDSIGKNTCLVNEVEVLNYAQVQREIIKVKKILHQNNHEERNFAYFEISNSVGGVIIYLALLALKIPFILSNKSNSFYSSKIIKSYDPKYLIADRLVEDLDFRLTHKYKNYYFYEKNSSVKYFINSRVAILMLTSGSTGSPKSCAISYKNLIHSANQICHSLAIEQNDRTITTLPPSYVYGLSIINSHLNRYASILLTDKSVIDSAFWNLIGEYGVNNFGGVPFQYEAIKKIFRNNIHLDGIRYLTQAGGKLSLDALTYFKQSSNKYGVKFYVMYGQTEATSRISVNEITNDRNPIESIGKGLINSSISLEKITVENEDPNRPISEIIYIGENVFLGYCDSIEDLDKLAPVFQGVLRTGDLGIQDANGYLYVTGRKKRIVKIEGIRISLDEIEAIFSNLGINVIALSHEDKKIILVTDSIAIEDLRSLLMDKTNIKTRAVEFRLVKEFPLKANNKVDYGKLKELVGDDAI